MNQIETNRYIFKIFLDYIKDFGNENYVLCVDFNLVLNQNLDIKIYFARYNVLCQP